MLRGDPFADTAQTQGIAVQRENDAAGNGQRGDNFLLTKNAGQHPVISMELSDGRKTFDFLPDAVSIEEGESVVNGEIRLDGHPIKQIPLQVLRENIAYVPQDNFLFSETLKQNISFGKQDATMDEIIEACKMADIHDNISEFPLKYETMVGERGVTLSGGQKQRASIARALLKDSPILIMDDSLSAVDTDTEDTILANLKKIREGKTTIMIAHRVSTVQNADHILVLDDGNTIEYGTYDELIARDGEFARMVRKQQLEKQLAREQEV